MPGKRDSIPREHVTACRGACDSMPGESCDDMVWICAAECGELRDSMTENVQHHVEGGGGMLQHAEEHGMPGTFVTACRGP